MALLMKAKCSSRAAAPSAARAQPARGSVVVCKAAAGDRRVSALERLSVMGAAAAASLLIGGQVHAEFRLPPIDSAPDRCDRGYVGNTIGQANAVSDKILDLRKCDFKGANLSSKVLAGALMADADYSGSNLQEAVLTKAYAVKTNFEGADMTNAVVDRVDFTNANLRGVKLVNAVVTGAIFEGADLTDTVWEDALIGGEDVKRLCKNPTLVDESRLQHSDALNDAMVTH